MQLIPLPAAAARQWLGGVPLHFMVGCCWCCLCARFGEIWRYRRCPFFAGRVLGKLKFVHICFKIMNVHRNQYELFPCCPRNLK